MTVSRRDIVVAALLLWTTVLLPRATAPTISTGQLDVAFSSQGELTAVTDTRGRRSVLLDGSRHTLLGVVLANSTAVTAPSAVLYDAASGLLRAEFRWFQPAVYLSVLVSTVAPEGFVTMRIVELVSQPGQVVDVMLMHIPVQLPAVAPGLAATFDEHFALAIMPVDVRTQPSSSTPVESTKNINWPPNPWGQSCNSSSTGVSLSALCFGRAGDLVGRGAALWGGPRDELDAAIQAAERAFDLPSPKIDGVWAKRSPHARSGYMMLATGPGAANINSTINYALASGMEYLMYYASFWASPAGPVSWGGHYNVSRSWGGLDGMKTVVKTIKAAGLRAGMHTMSGTIDPTDPYVTPVPDKRLAKIATGVLKTSVGAGDTRLQLRDPPHNLPGAPGYVPPPGLDGSVLLIDSEIISFATINITQPALQGVDRGKFGTQPTAHVAGAQVFQLIMGCGGDVFLPDPASDLTDEIAANLIRVFAGAGFEMLYLDGLDCHDALLPQVGGYGMSLFHQAVWRAMVAANATNALVESSGGGGVLWHLNTRDGQTDYAARGRRAFMDNDKLGQVKFTECGELIPADMGWWGFMTYQPGSYYSTTPDEVEYMASRAVGWSAVPGIESDLVSLNTNARAAEGLARIKPWFDLAERLPPAVKMQLRGTGTDREKEHRIVKDVDGREWIEIGQMHPSMIFNPSDNDDLVVLPFFTDDTSWGARIRALPSVNDESAIDLLQLNSSGISRSNVCTGPRAPSLLGGRMAVTVSNAPPPGGPAAALKLQYKASPCPRCGTADIGCVDSIFSAPLNLSVHRVLDLELHSSCDGSYGCAFGYLGVQLADGGVAGDFRDYIVSLNYTGWRTVRLAIPATRGMYTTDFPKPGNENMASRGFGWTNIHMISYYISNLSIPEATVHVGRLVALQETPAFVGQNATVTVGKHRLALPPLLRGSPCVVGHVGHTPAEPGFPNGQPTVLGCADYVECSDVANGSSCRAFDANGHTLPHAEGHQYTTPAVPAEPAANNGGVLAVPVSFYAAREAARVEVQLFEWSQEQLGPFGSNDSYSE